MKEIIIGLITGGALKATIDFARAWWSEHYSKKKAWSRLLPQVHEIYNILNVIVRESNVSRVVILKTENGGGVPKIGANLYSSILYEAINGNLETIKKHWQRQIIDQAYTDMLLDLNIQNELNLATSKLKSGMLKNLYEAHGVTRSRVFKIAEKPNRFIYISLNYADHDNDDARAMDILRYSINELRRLFEKHDL